MKVFITWSGNTSKAVAQALRDFIPTVLQSVEAFMSATDIEKGTRWEGEISRNLDDSDAGIICLTADNLTAPWILFEAGALSKKNSDSPTRVFTYLHGITAAHVPPPLSIFQSTVSEKDDTRRLFQNIKKICQTTLPDEALNKLFELLWPGLENELAKAPAPAKKPQRDAQEMIEEILGLTREMSKKLVSQRVSREVDSDLENKYQAIQAFLAAESGKRLTGRPDFIRARSAARLQSSL
jgi:hypothetical protein